MGQAVKLTQILLIISCILVTSHRPTHSLTPVGDTEAKVIGLAEQDVTHAMVLLSA